MVKGYIIVNVGYITFCSNLSYFETITVHAPHPPSPHTNLVPVSRTKQMVHFELWKYSINSR